MEALGKVLIGTTLPKMQDLPVPHIDKQRDIVKAYNIISDRVELKRKINDNLVAAGVTSIQKNIGNGALINLTEVDIENITLPDGFTIKTISEFCLDTKIRFHSFPYK